MCAFSLDKEATRALGTLPIDAAAHLDNVP